MPETSLRIFFHDRCFDGATSAALFAEFFRTTRDANAAIDYWGMTHSNKDPFEGVPLDAPVNACVDFRYCPDPRMHWWFDHHQSAFQPATLRQHFDANRTQTQFYDPGARSCALFEFGVMSDTLGFSLQDPHGHWSELLQWADRIDGAVFESAHEIVELEAPALQLMTWLRSNRSRENMTRTIETLGQRSLADVLTLPWIHEQLPDLLRAHRHGVEVIRERLEMRGNVVVYDLSNDDIEAHSGFAAYLHAPAAVYSVGLTHSAHGSSISVGCNPWAGVTDTQNIADICESYGGGGHPNVGGISLPPGQLDRARTIVDEIAETLNS